MTRVRLQGGPAAGEWHGPQTDADVIEVYKVRPHPPYMHPSQTKVDTYLYDLDGQYLGVVPEEWTVALSGEMFEDEGDEDGDEGEGGVAPEIVVAWVCAAAMMLVLLVGMLGWFAWVGSGA